jgi:hypothetical protein
MRSSPEPPGQALRLICHAGLDAVPPATRALFGDDLFDSLPWFETTCATALPPSTEALFIEIAGPEGPLALFPMRRDVARIAALTTPYTCLWRPLTAPGIAPDRLHGAGRMFGNWCRHWATVRLDALDLGHPFWPVLTGGMRAAGVAPLRFDHFGNWSTAQAALGWESYLAARPGALREAIRRRGKRAAAAGMALRLVRAPSEVEDGIAAYEAVYAKSWKPAEPFPSFNAALMRACAAQGSLRLGLLQRQGETLAAQFWVVQAGRATVLKLAHDEAHKDASPGTVLTALMIQHVLEHDQVTTLDFGRGDDEYKQSWTNMRVQREGLIVANPRRPGGLVAVLRDKIKQAKIVAPH